ncbi:MAG: TonB-dependent receptor domain-containing protein [Candidatus Kapaibacteriales bacterium]
MKYFLIHLLFLSLALLISQNLFADEIKGTVVNRESGKFLDSVEILIVYNNKILKSYTTDATGHFSFELPDSLKKRPLKILFIKDGFDKITSNITFDSTIVIFEKLQPKNYFTQPITIYSDPYSNQFHRNIITIEGKDLIEKISSTLGMTLQNEVDFFISSMGPITAKPSFRGLSQNYLRILDNKLPIKDFSFSAPDHAIAVDPLSFSKLEIIRGPKTLLYSNTSFGSIINLSKKNYLIEPITKPSYETFYLFESAYKSNSFSVKGEIPIYNFFVSTNLELKKGSDMRSALKVVPNTYFKGFSGTVEAGFQNTLVSSSAYFSAFKLNYGVPGGIAGAHPRGADIKLERQNHALRGLLHLHSFIDNVELKIERTYYYHAEYEKSGSVGAEFLLNDIFTDINFNIPQFWGINNVVLGIASNFTRQNYGGYVYAPNTLHYSLEFYNYSTFPIGDNIVEFASRFSHTFFKPEALSSLKKVQPINRSFNSLSSSINFIHRLNEPLSLSFLISRSERNPNVEELYSNGPHLAAYSYEIGNNQLKSELGYGFEFSTNLNIKNLDLFGSVFNYEFLNYIYPLSTGDTNYSQLLPIYQINSTRARKFGFDLSIYFRPIENLSFEAFLSFTKGISITTKKYLPMMPPAKGRLQAKFKIISRNELLIETIFSFKQTLLGENETETPGYVIFNLMLNRSFEILNMLWGVSLKLENITNKSYWNHLSRIKSIYPEPGRNLKLAINVFN